MTKYLQSRSGSIEEITKQLMDDYQAFFKSELEKAGKSIPSMTDSEKKAFFDKVAKDYNKQKEEEVKPGSFKDKIMKKIGQPIKDYNKKKEDVEKAPQGHEMRPGKLLLEPKKDDLKKQPKIQQEATTNTATYDLEDQDAEDEVKETKDNKDNKTILVVNPKNKKPGNDGVIKINKTDWHKYQAAGYIQAEAVVNPYAVGMAAAMKQTGDKPPLKKSTITKAHDIAKKIEKSEEVEEQLLKEKPSRKQSVLFKKADGSTVHKYVYGYDDTEIANQIKDIMSKEKLQILKKQEPESVKEEIKKNEELTAGQKKLPKALQKAIEKKEKTEDTEADKENKKLKIFNGERMPIKTVKESIFDILTSTYELKTYEPASLDEKKKSNVKKEDAQADKENQKLKIFNGERESVKLKNEDDEKEKFLKQAAKGRSDIINEAEKKKVDVKKDKKGEKDVNVQIEVEATNPEVSKGERITQLNDRIAKMTQSLDKLDLSKPENKTKQAIMKSDLNTAKLKLQDLQQKSYKTEKMNYKSYKKSLKKEQDTPKDKKNGKTMTGKPMNAIDTEPKIDLSM